MLNALKTQEKYQVRIETLSVSSNQLVVFTCPKCGGDEDYGYAYALRKIARAKSLGAECICQKCSHSHRKGQVPKVENKNKVYYPPEIDSVETFQKFGYYPEKLSPWSRNRVAVKCSITGKFSYPKRCGLNRNKAVIETGHFISKGAYIGERRRGKVASLETRKKMKTAQALRRTRERAVVAA